LHKDKHDFSPFVNCVQTNTPPEVITPNDAKLAVQTALATKLSLENGEAVVMD
jgi:hypothetical protein